VCPLRASLVPWEAELSLLSKEFRESEFSLELAAIFWKLSSFEESAIWSIEIYPVLAVEEFNSETIESVLFALFVTGLLQNELVHFIELILWEIKGKAEVFL